MNITLDDLNALNDEEFEALEHQVEKLISVWEIQNLRGNAAIFHDDQHIGEKRRELNAVSHPGVDAKALEAFRNKPVVDSLEGNMLIHPLTTSVIEVDETNTKARAVFWSMGIEGLSRFREKPTAILSLGMVPGAHVKKDGQWKILWGAWLRTTKNEYHTGFVHSMIPTNTRPALTPEQDRAMLGRFAYQKDEIRPAVPEPPAPDTWNKFPDEMNPDWQYVNLKSEEGEQ